VVRRTITSFARLCCESSLGARGCWQIAATTRTGSGHLSSNVAEYPAKRNRKDPICFSPYLYRDRNLVERFFNKIKQCRRVATRYDKLAANYLAFVKLACIRLWLRFYECTA
jgi:transposase